MMRELDNITIKGFKSIRSVEKLPIAPINILIGANGSGKSNFLGVFSFLREVKEVRLRNYVLKAGGANKILHFGIKTTDKLEIEISFLCGSIKHYFRFEPGHADGLYLSSAAESLNFPEKPSHLYNFEREAVVTSSEVGTVDPDDKRKADDVVSRLDQWRVYQLNDAGSSSPMKRTAYINDNRYLRPDGANLASFLYYIQQKHQTSYELIRRAVQLVAPFFDNFVLVPNLSNPDTIILEWRHKGSDDYFNSDMFSDGTLRFIAIATLFLQPDELRPSLILIDEPELGLHPYAITILASLIKQASVTSQIIVATQSPLLLDHFQPEDVLVAERVNGGTEFHRLEPDKLAKWLKRYSLGQLWEKNELGGRPGGR